MRTYYPDIEPFNHGTLQVSDLHTIYWEQCGNPKGIPVVFVHGGPGGGCSEKDRRFFNPAKYNIILFDQRGCGRSTPFAELTENTTPNLIADMERLRTHLGLDHWLVFGGSWGSTLALAYAQAHPKQVLGLVLRGIFLCRKHEIDWLYQEGASRIYPDAFATYRDHIPTAEQHDLLTAYHTRLTSTNETAQLAAAKHWSTWEMATSCLTPDPEKITLGSDPKFVLPFARIEAHYFINHGFMTEGQLLLPENIAKIRHIPTFIVHGRYDVVCPVENAWQLKAALPDAELRIIQTSGHASSEPGTVDALIEATDHFAETGQLRRSA